MSPMSSAITIRLTPDQRILIAAAARRVGLLPGQWMRSLAIQAAAQQRAVIDREAAWAAYDARQPPGEEAP